LDKNQHKSIFCALISSPGERPGLTEPAMMPEKPVLVRVFYYAKFYSVWSQPVMNAQLKREWQWRKQIKEMEHACENQNSDGYPLH
jgi:hypothetical protein